MVVVAAPQSHKPHFKCKATTTRTTAAASAATTTHTHSHTTLAHTSTPLEAHLTNCCPKTLGTHMNRFYLFLVLLDLLSLSLLEAAKYMNVQYSIYYRFSSQPNEQAQRAMRVRENRNSTNFEN